MMDESVQMSLVHFIATRRPNRNGWDKELVALKKAEVFTIGVLHLEHSLSSVLQNYGGDYGVAAA